MNLRSLFLPAAALCIASSAEAQQRPAGYIDPFIGTSNYGVTQPGPVVPQGMASMSPFNTFPHGRDHRINTSSWCSTPFVYENKWCAGFTQVNLSGVGCPDLGSILLMPTTGKLQVDIKEYASPLEGLTAEPGYMAARIAAYGVQAEMTATERTTRSRYTFPEGESHVLVNIGQGLSTESGCYARIVSNSEIEGFRLMGDFCYGQPQSVIPIYFVVRTGKTADKVRYWKHQPELPGAVKDWSAYSNKYKIYERFNRQPIAGDDIGVAFTFGTGKDEVIEVSVGISYVSIENARQNLDAEQAHGGQGQHSHSAQLPGGAEIALRALPFDEIRQKAVEKWDRVLGVVQLEGGTEAQKRQFYTSLYHNWIHPNLLSDVNGQYPEMQSGRTLTLPEGQQRLTVFSGWDVYRLTPFLGALFFPERQNAMALSLMQMYRESGNLPKFEVMSKEFSVMEGDPALPYLTGCWLLGLTKGIDAEELYQAMLKNATTTGKENPVRGNQSFYMQHHYIPLSGRHDNSVSQALECYVADWALGQMALKLGRKADYETLNARAMGYKNYFDRSYHLLRPKDSAGVFFKEFNPREGENFQPSAGFHEGSSWNYSFSIPYDIPGLIKLFGSPQRFADSLSACFDRGYFDMGNEPDMGYPYYFSYAKGSEWKTQYYVDQCLRKYFTDKPGGLPGNDDAGTMSAWQIFSMLGIYPATPGKAEYVITAPVFDKATIALDPGFYGPGRQLVIRAVNRTPENIYIDRIEVGGKPYKSRFISHDELIRAGELTVYCTNKPN